MSVNKYSFNIFNEKYQIVSDSQEDLVSKAVARVDALMKDISSKLESKDKGRVAILAALKLAEELVSMEELLDSEDQEACSLASRIEKELHP
jgi:cell division protein ZapA (FtsZ GTPase activity inhibitor)